MLLKQIHIQYFPKWIMNFLNKNTKKKISTYGAHLSKYEDFRFASIKLYHLYLVFYDSGISKMKHHLEYFTIITRDLKKGRFPAYLQKDFLVLEFKDLSQIK